MTDRNCPTCGRPRSDEFVVKNDRACIEAEIEKIRRKGDESNSNPAYGAGWWHCIDAVLDIVRGGE